MASVFDPATHRGVYATSATAADQLWEADKMAAIWKAANLYNIDIVATAPSDTTKIWFHPNSTNAAPGVFKYWNGAAWVAMTPAQWKALATSSNASGIVSSDFAFGYIPGNGSYITGLAFGADVWVMTVQSTINTNIQFTLSSSDFKNWTQRESLVSGFPTGYYRTGNVRFANGRFILVHGATIKWSTDGVAWTASTGQNAGQRNGDPIYISGNQWLIGNHGSNYHYSNDNGTSWTFVAHGSVVQDAVLFGGLYCLCGGNLYTMPTLGGAATFRATAGANFATNGTVLVSGAYHTSNGTSWIDHSGGVPSQWYFGVTKYFPATGKFAKVNLSGRVDSSTDGINYKTNLLPSSARTLINTSAKTIGISNGMLTMAATWSSLDGASTVIQIPYSLATADGETWTIGVIDAAGNFGSSGFVGASDVPKRIANSGGYNTPTGAMLLLA
jgi:hypothetical protein